MKRILYFAIVALAALACAKTTELEKVNEPNDGDIAVNFGVYTPRYTKADINSAADLQASTGFGVFAYYTDDNAYDQSYLPNFMWNQEVTYTAGAWTYAPIKYWPNEYGSNAVSGDVDKVSFFAYAPYVIASAATGSTGNNSGIVGVSRNRETGDPIVKYVVDFDPSSYAGGDMDLMWGVAAATDAGAWATVNGTAQQYALVAGMPWLNVERPSSTTAAPKPVKFTFNHALAKLNVTVDAVPDASTTAPVTPADPDAATKIYIREVIFTGFAKEGALNLNNVTADVPYWMSFEGKHTAQPSDAPIVIYDGKKNGSETLPNPNEKPAALNAALIQGGVGVTGTVENLFDNAALATDGIAVIPTGAPVDITIIYDVETADANLAGLLTDGTHGSSIENKITKLNVFTGPMVSGKRYTLNLHVGLARVDFDADVTAWSDVAAVNTPVPAN